MTFAATISEHPIPATAVGEVAGYLMEQIGEGADLLCIFVTPHHAGALEDIAAAFHTLLDPKVMIGCAAEAVIGPGREVEDGPAISAWAGNVGQVRGVRLDVVDNPRGGRAIGGWPIDLDWVPAAAVMFADPFEFPINGLFDVLNNAGNGFPRVIGGLAAAGRLPGTSRLVLDGEVYDSGAVGVLIAADNEIWVEPLVSQGCKPVGAPLIATSTQDNVIRELAGEPALVRLSEMAKKDLSAEEVEQAATGILVGRVVDEHKDKFGPGDFLVRTLLDADADQGTLTIGERVEVGSTLQFHVRDAVTADAELRSMLAERSAEAVLLFSCNGRGEDLFGVPDHDAVAVADLLDDPPTAGFFAAGEFGPVGGHNFVHGFTASMALFSRSDSEATKAAAPEVDETAEAIPNPD